MQVVFLAKGALEKSKKIPPNLFNARCGRRNPDNEQHFFVGIFATSPEKTFLKVRIHAVGA
jgi:hypothetical protein